MVLFNYSTKEITAKIVYYGPGLCGKTTNLQFVYESLPGNISKGKMLSLATKTDRTLFFDFLPIDLGTIRGMRTRLQLYTVPGQVFYNTTRKLVLKGADGVVFVADSQKRMLEANLESLKNLEENLAEHDLKLAEIPLILQFNKRDLPDVLSVEELNNALNRFNSPIYEAVATTGIGVHETLKASTRLVLNSLKERYADKREQKIDSSVKAAAMAVAAARESGQGPKRAPQEPAAPAPRRTPPTPPAPEPPPIAARTAPAVMPPPVAADPDPLGTELAPEFEEVAEASFADLDLDDSPVDLGSIDDAVEASGAMPGTTLEPEAPPPAAGDDLLLEVVDEPALSLEGEEELLELVGEPDLDASPDDASVLAAEEPLIAEPEEDIFAPEPEIGGTPMEDILEAGTAAGEAPRAESFEPDPPAAAPVVATPSPVAETPASLPVDAPDAEALDLVTDGGLDDEPLLADMRDELAEPSFEETPTRGEETPLAAPASFDEAPAFDEPFLDDEEAPGEGAAPSAMPPHPARPAAHQAPFEEDRSNLDLNPVPSGRAVVVAASGGTATVIEAHAEAVSGKEIQLPIQLAIGGQQIEFQLRIALDLKPLVRKGARNETEVSR